MQLGRARQRLEDRAVETRDVRDPEQVHGGRWPELLGRRLGEKLRQSHHPLGGEEALRTVQGQPERALPALQRLIGLGNQRALPPGGQHFGARERVLVEQRRQLGRQLDPLAIERVPVGALQIVPHRTELGPVQPCKIMEQPQQRPFDEIAVDDCRIGRALRGHLAQKAAQQPGLDVGGNAQSTCQPLFDVPLDERVGDHQIHGIEQARSPRVDGPRQCLDQRLEAIGAAKSDHARLF